MPSILRILALVLATGSLLHFEAVQASFAGISAEVVGQPVDQILISGNDRTQEKYILKWIKIVPGQPLTIAALNQARQELRDTGLFRQISFQAERFEDGELILHIILRERRFTLLLPRLSRNGDGDVKAGLRLRMYNLQGADRTLEMLAQQEEEAEGDDSEEFRMRLKVPLYSKPYDLTWGLRYEIENTEVEDFDNIETRRWMSLRVARDWHIDGWSVPLTVETGLTLEDVELDRPYPEDIEAIKGGSFNRLGLEFRYDDLHRERYRRYGSLYSVEIARGFDWLDSDYESNIVRFRIVRFRPLNRYDNLNYRLIFEVSHNSPFDYPDYGLGGASSIRGLEDFDERGDARLFSNIEYVFAYRAHPNLRHSLFVDFGNVYEDLNAVDPGDMNFTVGTGFRWKIESFVKTDLFVDYGYDIERSEGKLYGGTSLAF